MKYLKILIWSVLIFVILFQGVFNVAVTWANDQPDPGPDSSEEQLAPQPATIPLYLPLVSSNLGIVCSSEKNFFGVESWYFGPSDDMNMIKKACAYWLRRNSLEWMAVEPTPGARNWSAVSGLEGELSYAASQNKQVILVIRKTPVFARKVADSPCGPINDASLDGFANFMREVVLRYSVHPYNVKYFEIWNEQDAPVVSADDVYGCWGEATDVDYFGGRYYGRVLKAVYPKMKEANASIQVLMGGLVMDCDPAYPTPPGSSCNPVSGKYFEGILFEGAGNSFDGVNFHGYDYYFGGLGKFGNGNWHSAWNTTGPVLIEKVRYLKNIMAKYGINKPIHLTEVSLVCDSNCGSTFQTTKSYYLVQTYVTALAEGLESVVWYHLHDVWRNNGLLELDSTPHPAYDALKFTQSKLGKALQATDVSYGNVSAYEILTEDGKFWVAWSLNGTPQILNLPNVPTAGWDVYGEPISVGQSMQISIAPIFVQLH